MLILSDFFKMLVTIEFKGLNSAVEAKLNPNFCFYIIEHLGLKFEPRSDGIIIEMFDIMMKKPCRGEISSYFSKLRRSTCVFRKGFEMK